MNKLTLPGSKSITNRDLILASLATGRSTLRGFLQSEDTQYMIVALKKLGIGIQENGEELLIDGGVEKIKGNGQELFLGNSGTSVRFLTSLSLLNRHGDIIITGEDRMKERPIEDLIDGIAQIGCNIKSENGHCPLTIPGMGIIEKSNITMRGDSSSQYFTSLLQVAPLFKNGLTLDVDGDLVSKPYIDITINEMKKFGVHVENHNYTSFTVVPQIYTPVNIDIEGDASALSYIASYITFHGGEITITNLGNHSKQGDYLFLDMIKIFGLTYTSDGGTTTMKAPGIRHIDLSLYKDLHIDFESMPDVSLTFMILSIFLPGMTYITGLKTLNLKESLRIDAMRDELKKLGIQVVSDNESITIGTFIGRSSDDIIDIQTYKDHRIAMSFGILNSYIGQLHILNPACVSKTYPRFRSDLAYLVA